jgi:arabinosaccharide transport system substrate-binding protein
MEFPLGRVPLAMLLMAVVSGVFVLVSGLSRSVDRPDLIMAVFTKEHATAYAPAIKRFEAEHGVRVQLQLVDQRALQNRLQASLQVGAQVPDVVELLDGTLGIFTRGPVEDVGFLDLRPRLEAAGLTEKLVSNRFGKWTNRGRIFAVPHDVHPVMLAYRRDIVESLGIDVTKLTTWDEFARVGREIGTKDFNGDGTPDRYMLDLPAEGGDTIRILLLQRGGKLFHPNGDVAIDSAIAAETIAWYVRQVEGPGKISFAAGWGQNFAKAVTDGLVLFYFCPDWRSKQLEVDVPSVHGKMGLMPLPAWEEGGRRTTTWGGTGLAITRGTKNADLAWKLAMYLYFNPDDLGQRFADTNILPPLKSAWELPEFREPRAYFGGLQLGLAYAALADDVPEEQTSAYMSLAVARLSEAFGNTRLHYLSRLRAGDADPGAGLEAFAESELKRVAGRLRVVMNRNRFLKTDADAVTATTD